MLAALVFIVTTSADSGPGSLRQAILDANAVHANTQPGIAFHIGEPLPRSGFYTIRPRSPLPATTFFGDIDATTQGTSAAPLVMIDGSEQTDGDGITLNGSTNLKGVAIGNFKRYGVLVSLDGPMTAAIEGDYIGIDPNAVPAPNEQGIAARTPYSSVRIRNCVISGNRRCGIGLVTTSSSPATISTLIDNNRIGVAPDSDRPIPNGASGIYFPGPVRADISRNVIAHHPHFGIALLARQPTLLITANRIFDNAGNAIDYGFDGTTANVIDDSKRFPNFPVITDAAYDATSGKTTITFQLDTSAGVSWSPGICPGTLYCYFSAAFVRVELFVNGTSHSDTEELLGSISLGNLALDGPSHFMKEFAVGGDLRGRWISAVTIRSRDDCVTDECDIVSESSEPSPGFVVHSAHLE